MTKLLKTIAIASLFTVAGAQAQTYCEGSNACLQINQENNVEQVTTQHVTLKAKDNKTVCQGSEHCLEIEAKGK